MTLVAIAMGSNIGDRLGNMRKALRFMKIREIEVIQKSDVYETAPVGPQDQNRFLNACILVRTTLSPEELLFILKNIEQAVGRIEREKWGPREIDLDIILYEDRIVNGEDLVIPHAEFRERPFVLFPLSMIASDWIDPVTGSSIETLRDNAPSSDRTMIRISRL